MNSKPSVSVVMGVYNGGEYLRGTIESILRQTFKDFEFIIVNDGSTDNTGEILQEYTKKDLRVKIIEQENQGLTKALIAGCQIAQGEYIARQDCGDVSIPERLEKQLEHIISNKECGLVSCGTNFLGPEGEFLYTLNGKINHDFDGITHHGSALFPAVLYREVGGYRSEFYFAQDLDLWVRLLKKGKIYFCPETLYEARLGGDQISGINRNEQVVLKKTILALRDLWPSDPKYKALLYKASLIRPKGKGKASKIRKADQMYFLGRCLKSQGNSGYRHYLWECIKNNPLHIKAWLFLII